jgi:hypothetical protein
MGFEAVIALAEPDARRRGLAGGCRWSAVWQWRLTLMAWNVSLEPADRFKKTPRNFGKFKADRD